MQSARKVVAAADVGIGNRVLIHLPQGDGSAECGGTARQAHRFQRVAGGDRLAIIFSNGDAGQRQQRAFDLDEVHVPGIVDAGIAHRGLHAVCDHQDLLAAAKMVEGKSWRACRADG